MVFTDPSGTVRIFANSTKTVLWIDLPKSPHSYSPGHCKVHDFKRHLNVDDPVQFECVNSSTAKDLKVCLHQNDLVSSYVRTYNAWEPSLTTDILKALKTFPKSIFLDIGANIGAHSLTAAKLGWNVVAVEPNPETVKRLHKSVNLNNLQDQYLLVHNAVSDTRTKLTLFHEPKNFGASSIVWERSGEGPTVDTILFDDLLEVFPANDAVIKMDIEAAEPRALNQSRAFFKQVKVHVIFMEWDIIGKRVFKGQTPDYAERNRTLYMMEYLRLMDFRPALSFDTQNTTYLDDTPFTNWPGDVVWINQNALEFINSKK